ncbi:MAG: hypothetical protein ACHBN1_11130 [Heteroscytonema crispum UTEX LB 1556]
MGRWGDGEMGGQLTTNHQPNGRTSYLRECYPPAVRASPPTTNHQRPFGRTSTKEGNPPAVRASPPTTN